MQRRIDEKILICDIAKVNEKIVLCGTVNCVECDFNCDKNNGKPCEEVIKEWLDEEHIEKLLPCPFCGKEIDTETDMYIPERD